MKQFAPSTFQGQLVIDTTSNLPKLVVDKYGLQISLEEANDVYIFLKALHQEIKQMTDKKYNMDVLATNVWQKNLQNTKFPSNGENGVLHLPMGSKGLRIKARYYTDKNGDTYYYGCQLLRYNDTKCVGVGIQLTAETVCSTFFWFYF